MSQGVKRKRTTQPTLNRKKVKSHGIRPVSGEKGPAVRGDALKWNEVSVSQHLDDAEGFFGLEEIDEVEVVKGEDGKGAFFRPTNTADVVIEDNEDNENAEEWSGFEEESTSNSEDQTNIGDEVPPLGSSIRMMEKELSEDELAATTNFEVLPNGESETGVDVTAWAGLDLHADLLSSLSSVGFSKPTKIQEAAIPSIRAGKDVIGKAVTGSGKTLAFGLPMISFWLETSSTKRTSPTALILAPTRELAHQITKHLTAVCERIDTRPRVIAVTGGLSVLKQQRQLET
ncbi:ATP-dependent RNA helicase, partial [Elasticomyces elasticus]